MIIYLFRHGETTYQQDRVLLDHASDLTPKGIETVRESANDLATQLDTLVQQASTPIRIHSSPFGRCLHTAKVIQDILSKRGFKVQDIAQDELLAEVENWNWELFFPLVTGTEIEYEGSRLEVNKELTNPKNLSLISYFREDAVHKLSDEAKRSLPKEYLEKIAQFERSTSVTDRLRQKLELLDWDKKEVSILTTHEGLTGDLVQQLSSRNDAFLDRGKYFGVRKESGILLPYHCQADAINYENSN